MMHPRDEGIMWNGIFARAPRERAPRSPPAPPTGAPRSQAERAPLWGRRKRRARCGRSIHPLVLLVLLGQLIKYLIKARCMMALANRENKRPTGCYMWLHVGFRIERVRRAFAMLIGIGYTGNASLLAYFRLGVRVS